MMIYIKIYKSIPPENIWQFKKYLNCQYIYNEIQLKDFNNNKYTLKNYDKFITTNSIIHNLNTNYNLNYDPGYVFFSEEPVNIEVMSPFMHRSGFNKNGYIVPGTYDISKWFRPLNPALQLYDNEDRVVESSKGDALMYIKFNCSDSVKLEKFYIDKELDSIIYGASGYKNYDPNRSLPYLYDKFEKAGLKKRTLKLIKENLI